MMLPPALGLMPSQWVAGATVEDEELFNWCCSKNEIDQSKRGLTRCVVAIPAAIDADAGV